jgi:hypothetical protein
MVNDSFGENITYTNSNNIETNPLNIGHKNNYMSHSINKKLKNVTNNDNSFFKNSR